VAERSRQPVRPAPWWYLLSPAALVAATILFLLIGHSAPLGDLWRPLALGLAVTFIVQSLATRLMRDTLAGTYVAGVVVAVALGIWALAGVLLLLPAWWWAVGAIRRRSGRPAVKAFPIATIARSCAILAIVLFMSSVARVAMAFSPWDVDPAAHAVELPGSGGPDIFVIVLDGYAREDTLENEFGIDNSGFLADLEKSGFVVDDESQSNYMKSWLTIASMLHMEYVQDIPIFQDPTLDPAGQHRLATRAILQAPFVEALRHRGYEIAAGTSSFTETDLTNADRVLDAGQPTNFENHIMEITPIAGAMQAVWPGLLARLQADQVSEGLGQLRTVASGSRGRPIFMLSHVEAPHTPFALDAAGNPAPMPPCYPRSCTAFEHYITTLGMTQDVYGEQLAGYLAWTNEQVLRNVEEVVHERPNAVVIVMSDHGSRFDPNDPDEHFRNLFAARTPGKDGVFPAGTSPVNVFRSLSNAYFGTDLPLLPYRAWFSNPLLLDLVPWDVAPAD
jgi:hypothetical protein